MACSCPIAAIAAEMSPSAIRSSSAASSPSMACSKQYFRRLPPRPETIWINSIYTVCGPSSASPCCTTAHAGNAGMVSCWRATSAADAARRWLLGYRRVELSQGGSRKHIVRLTVSQTLQSGPRVDRAIKCPGRRVKSRDNVSPQPFGTESKSGIDVPSLSLATEVALTHLHDLKRLSSAQRILGTGKGGSDAI